ncbi:MAG: endonuclease/exonuclease/phosphatase family protein [Muribaculaceae bacterium]|nr:endonuclease/exonuclease/phosphatase family protein [Muribaculaceae bacterium]
MSTRELKNYARAAGRVLLAVLNVATAAGLILSAYSGCIAPQTWKLAPVVTMTFPGWVLGIILVGLIDLFTVRRWLWLCGATLAVASPTLWNYSPLHIPYAFLDEDEKARSFTFLTYNVYNFESYSKEYPDNQNPALKFILQTDADVVCLQEALLLQVNAKTHITQEQMRRLSEKYPYIMQTGEAQMLLSKFPTVILPMRMDKNPGAGKCDVGAFRVTIDGQDITIFDVHLQSFGLTSEDKEAYRDFTRSPSEEEMGEVRTLVSKIAEAARKRAMQTEVLMNCIKKFGGPNVIVSGDFNDVPCSYSLRRLGDVGLKQVYPRVALGPMVTYYANKFYFRIDHVLYRGSLTPVELTRPKVKASDHYPQIITFVLDR